MLSQQSPGVQHLPLGRRKHFMSPMNAPLSASIWNLTFDYIKFFTSDCCGLFLILSSFGPNVFPLEVLQYHSEGKNIYPSEPNGGANSMDLILICSVCPFSDKIYTEVNGSRFCVTVIMPLEKRKNLSEAFIFRQQCISFLDEENQLESKYNWEDL